MEKNTELEGSYTTEYRQLDTRIGRWTGVDPAADLYYSWSPYNLSMNNPILNSDPSGATTVIPNAKKGETDYGQLIISDWNSQAGLNITRNGKGVLSYTIDPSNKFFSPDARKYVTDAIDGEALYSFEFRPGEGSEHLEDGTIVIDPLEIQGYIDAASESPLLDSRTMGYGLVSIHEILHTPVDPSWVAPDKWTHPVADLKKGFGLGPHRQYPGEDMNAFGWGSNDPVLSAMNGIRFQLGRSNQGALTYGSRFSYAGRVQTVVVLGVTTYYDVIPFDGRSLEMMTPDKDKVVEFPDSDDNLLYIKRRVPSKIVKPF
jgi:RHS repeat-associated protein